MLLLNEFRASVWVNDKVLEMGGSDRYTTLWMVYLLMNCENTQKGFKC